MTYQRKTTRKVGAVSFRAAQETHDVSQHQFLITTEAANLLRVDPKTLCNKRCSGDGPPFIRVGGRVVYDRADLIAWLSQNKCRSTSERPEVVSEAGGDKGAGR